MIYNGTETLGEIPQVFNLTSVEYSWVNLKERNGKDVLYKQWDIFTVSSHAAFSLGKLMLRKGLGKRKRSSIKL